MKLTLLCIFICINSLAFAANQERLEFYNSSNDNKNLLAVVIPGFNVKPKVMEPIAHKFAENGIPTYLFHFSGTKNDENHNLMTFANWNNDIKNSLKFLINEAKISNKKLIILAHSMGGLYALKFLSKLSNADLSNIYNILLAPADGLKSIKSIIIEKLPLATLFSNNLPLDNIDLIKIIKNGFNLGFMSINPSMIESFPLGEHICGSNAAQSFLPFSAFEGLILPTNQLKYNNNIVGCVVFYENDPLMDASMYNNYKNHMPKKIGRAHF